MLKTTAEKQTQARVLLRRLLSDNQWREFCEFGSFREIVRSKDGLPWQNVEFGMKYSGWIQFDKRHWNIPIFFRNAYIYSNQRDWIHEDHIISLLMRVRTESLEVLESNWACQSIIQNGCSDFRKIMDRTYHTEAA